MALTSFQSELIRLLSENRKAGGESYIAGGTALNTLLGAPRLSRDVDIFHDSREAVHVAFEVDVTVLEKNGVQIDVEIDRGNFVEIVAKRGSQKCKIQWTQDSAFRFFPLLSHHELGLTLHPFDLATNKVLALVGRAEPRDWVDAIECSRRLQPLGYLAWAAAGKDAGLNPLMILEQASRTGRYSEEELATVEFEGVRPTAGDLSLQWKDILEEAFRVVGALPESAYGTCLFEGGELARLDAISLDQAMEAGTIQFHAGCLRGAFPSIS